jgi:hypothetical protein
MLVKVKQIRGSDDYEGSHGLLYSQYMVCVDAKGAEYRLKVSAKTADKWAVGDKFEASFDPKDRPWGFGGEQFIRAKASREGYTNGNGSGSHTNGSRATNVGGASEEAVRELTQAIRDAIAMMCAINGMAMNQASDAPQGETESIPF